MVLFFWMDVVREKTMAFFSEKEGRQCYGHRLTLNGTQIKNNILFELSCNCYIGTDTKHEIVCFLRFHLSILFPFIKFFPFNLCRKTVGNKITNSVRRRKEVEIFQIVWLCVFICRFVIHNIKRKLKAGVADIFASCGSMFCCAIVNYYYVNQNGLYYY